MIVSREQYDAVGKGQPLLMFRSAKRRRRGRATAFKNGREVETFGPIKITEGNGTILEPVESIGLRESKCPYPVDRTATLRYRDYPKGFKRERDPLPPIQGKGIPIIVTEAEQQEDGRWLIRWERVGPHRPMPVAGSNKFLAPARGWTTSPTDSIDKEAPAMPSAEIDAMVADDLAAKREARERALRKFESAANELTDELDTAADGKAVRKIERMAAELRELLAQDDEQEAA